jgi:branched-chain amino acid transport system permease protein
MPLEWLNPYHLQVASFMLINAILGVSIYVTLSTGQLSLGNAGFMGIGAYTAALLSTQHHVPIPVGIVAGSFLAGAAGILVGIPSLRLSGVYLAIATLGFGEVLRAVLINWESLTGGAVGVAAIPQMGRVILAWAGDRGFSPGSLGLQNNQFISLTVFLVLLLCTVVTVAFFLRLSRSRVGRAYAAIRLDESAAEAAGIPTTYYKVLAFSQGALLSGFAGALFAHSTSFVSPGDFTYHRAVEILVFAVFGGSEHIFGPVFGAAFLTFVPEALRAISDYRYILYGFLLVLMMVYRPQGVIDPALLRRLRRPGKETPA